VAKTILLVEDNSDSRELIHLLLTRMGFTVLDAIDGQEGLCKADAEHPDLIITDIGMPHLDGIGMIKELRSHPCFEDLPILALTSYGRKQREEAIEAGANRVLKKPSVFESLVTEVERLLDRGP
jgi:CheY-like chemotaxis protein